MKRNFLLLFILLISIYSCNLKQKKADAETQKDILNSTLIKVGQDVPDFEYICMGSDTINIKDLKGNVVFINFFATSCPICIKELPFIEKEIWQKHKENENFRLIVFGREHSNEEMITFKKKKGYTFSIVPDPKRKIYSLFAKKYIPRNIVLNKEGKIIYEATGFNEEEFSKLKAVIELELNK